MIIYSTGNLGTNKWKNLKAKAKDVTVEKSPEQIKDWFNTIRKEINLSEIDLSNCVTKIIDKFFIEKVSVLPDKNVCTLNTAFAEKVYGGFEEVLSVTDNKIVVDKKLLGNSALSNTIRNTIQSKIDAIVKESNSPAINTTTTVEGNSIRKENYTLFEKLVYVSLLLIYKKNYYRIAAEAKKYNAHLVTRSSDELMNFFKNANKKLNLNQNFRMIAEDDNDRFNYSVEFVNKVVSCFLGKYKNIYIEEANDECKLKEANRVFQEYGGFKFDIFSSINDTISVQNLQLPEDRMQSIFVNSLQNAFLS